MPCAVAERRVSAEDARARAKVAIEMLTARYRADAAALCDRFAAIGVSLAGDPSDANALAALQLESHRVRGTAGSLGFDAASERCGEIEERAERWLADPMLDRGERARLVADFAGALRGDFGYFKKRCNPI